MSANINQHSDFLRLFLNTEPYQQKALLFSITPEQLDVLSEIFHNLLTLPLTQEESRFVKRREEVISKLANISKSVRSRRQAVNKHTRQILTVLGLFKDKILSVIPPSAQKDDEY